MSDLSGDRNVTDQYLVAAEVRERLKVSKRATQEFYTERLHLKKRNDVKISKTFAILENLDDDVNVNSTWENDRTSTFQPKTV
jgi:hypothetical protein